MNISVGEIAELIGGNVVGDKNARITGLNGIKEAGKGDLTFLSDMKHVAYMTSTLASAVVVSTEYSESDKILIQVTDPYAAFAKVLNWYEKQTLIHPKGIHKTAIIAEDVSLGEGVSLGPNVCIEPGSVIGDGVVIYSGTYVGRNCTIGADTVIYANVSMREGTRIGARCIIHAGAALGNDGFGFLLSNERRAKIPQVGIVILGDDVELGANTCVDRATCGETVIGDGTKIDNLVQIAHNVRIGKHCVISGQSGIAGSTKIGDHVTMAAQVGITGHIEVGDNTIIAGKAGVTKTIESGRIISGFPAIDHIEEKRIKASLKRLPHTAQRVKGLEDRVQELEELLNGKATNNS